MTEGAPRRRWRIAWLMGLGVLVNYFDRVNLSVSHGALYTAFGISDVAFGYLSAAYNWSYALCQLPVGVVLDRFGVRRVQRIGIFIWSMASFAAALTTNLTGFFAARLLLGIGEAPTFPANAKAIGVWFPARERSFATSLTDAAAKAASAVGVPLLGILLLRVGWRWSFAATGAISLLYLLIFWVVYREPEEDEELTDAERRLIAETHENEPPAAEGPALSLGALLKQRKVIGLSLGFGSYNYVFYLLLTWLPSYLSGALHIDLLHSFLYTGAPWLFATATDLFLGGMLVDALVSRGWNAPLVRKVVLVAGTACGLGILGGPRAQRGSRVGVDQPFDRWTCRGSAGRLVDSGADYTACERRKGGRHRELCMPGLRNYRANPDRLYRASNALVRPRIWNLGDLLAVRDRRLPGAAGAHRAHEDKDHSLPCRVVLVDAGATVAYRKAAIAAGGDLDVMAGIRTVEIGDVLGVRIVRSATLVRIM